MPSHVLNVSARTSFGRGNQPCCWRHYVMHRCISWQSYFMRTSEVPCVCVRCFMICFGWKQIWAVTATTQPWILVGCVRGSLFHTYIHVYVAVIAHVYVYITWLLHVNSCCMLHSRLLSRCVVMYITVVSSLLMNVRARMAPHHPALLLL